MKEHEMGRTRNTYEMRNGRTVSFGKLEGKRSLTTPTRTTEDNIDMTIKEIVYKDVDWNLLVQDIIDCTSHMYAMKLMVPQRR
jgi:hypothetical protein